MTREQYKHQCLILRTKLQATDRNYLNKFLDYWFWNVIGDDRKRYRRDLQTFLRGSGYVHGLAEPYLFFERIEKYLTYHANQTKQNQRRALAQETAK